MTKKLLNEPEMGTSGKQVAGTAVADGMYRQALVIHPGVPSPLQKTTVDRLRPKSCSMIG